MGGMGFLPGGISAAPFQGVSVNRRLLNVILMYGWFFFILSKISVGSGNGRMTRRCSGWWGPPPIMMVEARWPERINAAVLGLRRPG